MDDEALLAAWRGGDPAAGQELFRRYFDGVYRFFRTKLDGPIDDLVQETFLSISRVRDELELRGSFRSYIFATARNALWTTLRARARMPEIDFMVSSVADLGTSPSAELARREEHAAVFEALRALPAELQVIVELRHFEGMSGPELAAALGLAEGTVRSRLRRATDELRESVVAMLQKRNRAAPGPDDLEVWLAQMAAIPAAELMPSGA
jgi:RNA polymerase sigma factor (sigma-70 family)